MSNRKVGNFRCGLSAPKSFRGVRETGPGSEEGRLFSQAIIMDIR